jgi:hypothetical protein
LSRFFFFWIAIRSCLDSLNQCYQIQLAVY